jgi:integrase
MGKSLRNMKAEAEHRLDRFDVAAVRAMKSGDWFTFAGHSGLRLERNGASRTFLDRYRSPVDGRLRQVKLGRWPAISFEKAAVRWDEVQRLLDDGIDPQLERRRKRAEARTAHVAERKAKRAKAITVAKVVEHYVTHQIRPRRRPAGAAKAERLFAASVLAKFGGQPADEIRRADAAAFLLSERARAPAQAAILRREMGAAWRFASGSGLLPESAPNPWGSMSAKDLGVRSKPRSRALNDAEIATLLGKLGKTAAEDVLRFLLYVGCRSNEACSIAPGDVVDGVWHLVESKTGTTRDIHLPRPALAIFERHPKGFGVTPWTVGEAVRAAGCYGLPHFVVHDLRRSLRTGLARIGVRSEIAELAIGHTRSGIEAVYNTHKFEHEIGEALAAWARHVDALASPQVVPMVRTRRRSG